MNRFPMPAISKLSAVVSFVYGKPSAGFGPTVSSLKSGYGWGPSENVLQVSFAVDAAAAEARERTLFSDSLMATAF